MKTILLIRESAFQIYCANTLFLAGLLDEAMVEDGISVSGEKVTIEDFLSKLRAGLYHILTNPISGPQRTLLHLRNLLNHHKYYGDWHFHHQRILNNYLAFEPKLPIIRVNDINGSQAISYMQKANADLVFVHGTRLIRRAMLESVKAPFVNLHWGWSPNYRAEGIVSALALEGPIALGVTVHLIDEGIDSGDILYQARPTIDTLDNFYSIGLKLTVLGTDLFLRVADDYSKHGELIGAKQMKHKSQLFSGQYLRNHPELHPLAWKNLRNFQT